MVIYIDNMHPSDKFDTCDFIDHGYIHIRSGEGDSYNNNTINIVGDRGPEDMNFVV